MSDWWSRFSRRLSSARGALREADLALLARIALFASIVPLLMRLSPARLQRWFGTMGSVEHRSPNPADVQKIVRHLQLAGRVASPLVQTNCRTRGLTLYYFLRRRGFDVTLWFGLGRAEGAFSGHCWLALDGAPFLEPGDPRTRYTPIFRIPVDSSGGAAGNGQTSAAASLRTTA